MKPPVRLLDDPDLSAQLRTDLELAVHTPQQFDVAAGLTQLRATLDAPQDASAQGDGAAGGDSSAAQYGALSQGKALPWGLKAVWTGVAGVSAVVLGVIGASYFAPGAQAPAWRSPAPRAGQPAEPAAAAEQSAGAKPSADAAPFAQPSTDAAPVAPPTAPGASASRREIAQLVRIKQLLRRDPAAAYRLARASQREFPSGALREEREGLAAIAAWLSGPRARARALTEQYLARYAQSPLRERLERLAADAER
jgi:hypothetical protein